MHRPLYHVLPAGSFADIVVIVVGIAISLFVAVAFFLFPLSRRFPRRPRRRKVWNERENIMAKKLNNLYELVHNLKLYFQFAIYVAASGCHATYTLHICPQPGLLVA